MNFSHEKSKLKRNRVLMVNNDKTFNLAIMKFFKGSPFKIDTASSISRAIDLLETIDYDVLATDLIVDKNGKNDGIDLIGIAKDLNESITTVLFSSPCIIREACTASAGEKRAVSPDIVLEKPVSLIALEEAIFANIQSLKRPKTDNEHIFHKLY